MPCWRREGRIYEYEIVWTGSRCICVGGTWSHFCAVSVRQHALMLQTAKATFLYLGDWWEIVALASQGCQVFSIENSHLVGLWTDLLLSWKITDPILENYCFTGNTPLLLAAKAWSLSRPINSCHSNRCQVKVLLLVIFIYRHLYIYIYIYIHVWKGAPKICSYMFKSAEEGREDVVEYFLAKANLQPNCTDSCKHIFLAVKHYRFIASVQRCMLQVIAGWPSFCHLILQLKRYPACPTCITRPPRP